MVEVAFLPHKIAMVKEVVTVVDYHAAVALLFSEVKQVS